MIGVTDENAPDNDLTGDLAEKDIEKNAYNDGDSYKIQKNASFTVPIPADGSKWVRVVEQEKSTEPGEDKYSTVFLGSGFNGVQSGKDSGWVQYTGGETSSLFCVNYTQHPIVLTKYRLDGAERKSLNTDDIGDDTLAYQTMSGVKFDLYKYESGNETAIASGLTTDDEGKLYLNDIYDSKNSPRLEGNKTYILRETAPTYYKQAPDIYFSTTDGISPKVKELWYYDGESEESNKITYTEKDYNNGDDGYGQIAFANESGREIRIYNERLTGKVTVKKTINEPNAPGQGNAIFLFKAEKFAVDENGDQGAPLPGTQTVHVRFEPTPAQESEETAAENGTPATPPTATATFENLEAGYYYRISESDTIRYGIESVNLTGANDVDDNDNTVTFLLTDDLARPGTTITASVTNTRNYANYLSDALLAVNAFTYKPWPAPSAPVVHTVTITQPGHASVELSVTEGDLIDISKLKGLGFDVDPDEKGKIGEIPRDSSNPPSGIAYPMETSTIPFYLYTPITGDWTVTLLSTATAV